MYAMRYFRDHVIVHFKLSIRPRKRGGIAYFIPCNDRRESDDLDDLLLQCRERPLEGIGRISGK